MHTTTVHIACVMFIKFGVVHISSLREGCNAQTVTTISIDYVNCQSLGVVYITSGSFFGQSTVCNTVDQETANYICNNLNYGNVTNYGTAGNLG